MFTKGYARLVILCFCVTLAGCVTSRSEIKLPGPTIVAPATTATSAQHVVVIGKITDERVFEDGSDDPSTPSLGFGGAGKATDDIKARAVARKRNTYGMALGDVVLQPGQTVESVIRENLAAAFQQAGYQVKDEGDAGPSPLVVDVHIKKFWSWFTPGFWAITLENEISTDLVLNGVAVPMVSAHVEEKHAVTTDKDWIEIVDKGLDAYRAEVSHRMQGSDIGNIAVTAAPPLPLPPSPKQAPVPAIDANPATAPSHQPTTPVAAIAEATPSTSAASVSSPAATASSADTSIAQAVANQLGCGAVQANGGSTFVAPCSGYSVLIDCDGGQCRPMHTINVKNDE